MARPTPRKFRKSPLAAAIGSLLAVGAVQAAVITVDTVDDGPAGSTPGCSLRSAVASANGNTALDDCAPGSAGADEIVFDQSLAGSIITLTEGEIEILTAMSITGPSPDDPTGITIDANEQSRIFKITGKLASDFQVELANLTVTRGRTTGSSQQQAQGGAIRNFRADLTLNHVDVTNSSIAGQVRGGGIYSRFGNATLNHSTVSGNFTEEVNAGGGGMGSANGNVLINHSTISGNSTANTNGKGGGMLHYEGTLTMQKSTVSGNSTAGDHSSGGGLAVLGGNLELINSTVSGNSASGDNVWGGGISVFTGDLTLTHATVAYNTGGPNPFGAAGVYHGVAGDTHIYNSLIVQEGAGETACILQAGARINTLATDDSCTGIATSLEDIALMPLSENHGATPTHRIQSHSVAVDAAGDCVNDYGVTTDQRGHPRPTGAACDIGAFEIQDELPPSIITVTTNQDAAPGVLEDECTLRSAVLTSANFGTYDACAPGSPYYGSQIEFDPALAGETITLNQGQISIFWPLTISGPIAEDPTSIIIDANEQSRILNIQNGTLSDMLVELENLTLMRGRTTGDYQHGGAIYATEADLHLDHVTLTGNSTQGHYSGAGAIHLGFGGLRLANSLVANNSTSGEFSWAGGLAVDNAELRIENSSVINNTTTSYYSPCGGLIIQNSDTLIRNSTISGNSVLDLSPGGGGICALFSDLELEHATVAENYSAAYADGILFQGSGSLTLTNSMVVQSGEDDLACDSAADSHTNSLATDTTCTGTAIDFADFELGPLGYHGGNTPTIPVGENSIARNAAGDCNALGVNTDQRGEQRPGAGSEDCDIGAFELQGEAALSLSLNPMAFGDVRLGHPEAMLLIVTSTGSINLEIDDVGPITGSDPGAFAITFEDCVGTSLGHNQTCAIQVTFTPDAEADFDAGFEIGSNAEDSPDTVDLTGSGVLPVLSLSTDSVDFGQVPVGESEGPITVTLTNSGSGDLEIGSVGPLAGDNPEVFEITADTCAGTTLPAGQNCAIGVIFLPNAEMSFNANFEIASDAPSSPDTVSLTGVGFEPEAPGNEVFSDRFKVK